MPPQQNPLQILSVALPTPLRKAFDYLSQPLPSEQGSLLDQQDTPPQQSIPIGSRVQVPFGRQTLVGVVIDNQRTPDELDVELEKLKAINKLLDPDPLLDQQTLSLLSWAAHYYQHPIGDVIATALPASLRQGENADITTERYWQLTKTGRDTCPSTLKRAPKQAQALQRLQTLEQQGQRLIAEAELLLEGAINKAALNNLRDKLLAETKELIPEPQRLQPLLKEPALELNTEQQQALNSIDFASFYCHLLYGTTGSGKTEVYLQAIEQVLKEGKQALVLIPEIGLTPQTLHRFEARFNRPLAILHSGLADGERKQAWLKAQKGLVDIVIGTRSAVFTPMQRLGIIIIDEEHDLSFKQQEGFRYSARDLAAIRANKADIPLILGTATPSLETLHNAKQQRYSELSLPSRAGNAKPPSIQLLDIRQQKLHAGLATPLLESIRDELSQGNQVLVFINRRGFAPTVMCHDCGWTAHCPHCDARLTVHQNPPHLHCHHCDYQRPLIHQCHQCNSHDLQHLGQGSEQTEEYLQQLFPDTPVIRVDRDSTRRKNAMQDILDQVHSGDPCILVGTQMLAKGHHFPNVTLVAIVDADNGLFSADFRGPERTGQLLLQVSGRAGRAEKPGRVVIQSHLTDHPLLRTLLEQGYDAFTKLLLAEREIALMPPYRYMALLRAEDKSLEQANELLMLARRLAETLQPSHPQLQYLGPLPAPMERRNGRFRCQLQINADSRARLHQLLQPLIAQLDAQPLAKKVRWSVDVDPLDMN